MVYLKSLEIENLRCFGRRQKVDFTNEGKISQWTVILGENGTGKTTLLRSLAAMLPAPESFLSKRSNSETEHLLSIERKWLNIWDTKHKDGYNWAKIWLTIVETTEPFGTSIEASEQLYYSDEDYGDNIDPPGPPSRFNTKLFSPVYCFGYGANRRMSNASLSDEDSYNGSETLFLEDALLQNSAEFFLRIDYETAKSKKGSSERDKVKELLLKILPQEIKDIRVAKTGRLQREVQIESPYGWINITDLSLGYKTTVAWLLDFAAKMMYYYYENEKPFDQPAILILDEIDLHLHPAWQREIIDSLSKTFPRTQFIVTAHSPLIAQSALKSNLVLTKRITDHVIIENNPEVIKSWRIDQILTSDLFGIKTSRSKDVEKQITRRRKLLKLKDDLTEEQKEELKRLNLEIDNMPVGDTKAEIDAVEVLKDFAEKLEAAKNNQRND